MEGQDVGDAPLIGEGHSSGAGQPVVGVHHVVAEVLGTLEGVELVDELGDVLVGVLLGPVVGAGLEVDDPGVLAEGHYLLVPGVVPAGVDVDGASHLAERSRGLEDVDVHAAGVALSKARHRAAVYAQHGDSVHMELRMGPDCLTVIV